MLQELKSFNASTTDITELVAMYEFGNLVSAGHTNFNLPAPEWLPEKLTELRREITARRKDELARRLKILEGKIEINKQRDPAYLEKQAEELRQLLSQ
jgi:hypothetical protein